MDRITSLPPNHIFVFGSNLAGIHGAGAARDAVTFFRASWGVGEGLQGQSYALPTKDRNVQTLPQREILKHIHRFMDFAKRYDYLTFHMTPVGTGYAGLSVETMCGLFACYPNPWPKNIIWPKEFTEFWDEIGFKSYKKPNLFKRLLNR